MHDIEADRAALSSGEQLEARHSCFDSVSTDGISRNRSGNNAMSTASDETQRRDQRALWQSRLRSADKLANKALQREKDGDLNTSYSLCLQAARAYLWLIRNSPDDNTTKNLKAISVKLLTRAEKIKQSKKDVYATPVSRLDEC